MSRLTRERRNMMKLFYVQGDVQVLSVDSLPEGLKEIKSNVLAEGEVTGHLHACMPTGSDRPRRLSVVSGLSFFEAEDGTKYVKADNAFDLLHDEHNPISFPAGTYRVGLTREYDYSQDISRNVAD